jgi:hypothetical protein
MFQSLKRDIPLCNALIVIVFFPFLLRFNRSSATSLYATPRSLKAALMRD